MAEFEGFNITEWHRRTVPMYRILRILQRAESFAQRIFKASLKILLKYEENAPEVPRILCARYLASLLKMANHLNEAITQADKISH